MVDIEADAVQAAAEEKSRELAGELANRWFSRANEILTSAGDELEYETFPVVQSGTPPQWDEAEGAFVMSFSHAAASYFEYGTTAHEVKAKEADVLAFEWPEMANERFGDTNKTFKEVFSDTWPTVFFPETQPDGIPAIRYLQRGREHAKRWLARQEQ